MDTYLVNKLFTIPYLDKAFFEKKSRNILYECLDNTTILREQLTFEEVLNRIYDFMNEKYRNEYFYKNAIMNQLLIEKHDINTTAALTELPVAESKADFVLINGKGIVYEIKTDLDNLLRLKNQINDYYKVFCYVYVVASSKQMPQIRELVENEKVGYYELSDKGKLICRKRALFNNENLSYEAIFGILRKNEYENIIMKHFKQLPKVGDFEYYRECFKWIKKININTLQKDVMKCLKQRTLSLYDNDLVNKIPYELRFYAYFSKQNKNNYEQLHMKLKEFVRGD